VERLIGTLRQTPLPISYKLIYHLATKCLKSKVMSSPSHTIDHTTLARLVEAGAVRAASVIGQPAGWGVIVKYGKTERPLAARRGQVRTFRRLETVVNYLKEIGIARFDVDAVNYDPEQFKTARTRPDSAAAMKRAHEAVAHDKWFREQVQRGIKQLNSGDVVSEEEHDARWAKRQAALVKRAASSKA